MLAEAFDRLAGLGVQFDQAIAGGDIDDAVIAIAVGPISDATLPESWRGEDRGAQAFIHGIDPLQFAGLGVQRHDRAARTGGGVVISAVDFNRGAFQPEFRIRAPIASVLKCQASSSWS